MKKKKIKIKIKLKRIIIVLLVFSILGLLGYGYTTLHIKNIYVKGNNLLKEQDIIDDAELSNYPKIVDINKKNIENKLLQNELINKVNINISLFGKVVINIDENKILYKKDNNYMLSNGKIISLSDENTNVPILINEIDEDVLPKFIKNFELINEDIRGKISEILYDQTELDHERFLFYMNDGNAVYVTLSKIDVINNYNEIYPTLDGNIGILYLDSGNHFQIKKEVNK